MAGRSLDMMMTVAARFGGKTINLAVFLLVARALSLEEMGVYGFIFSMTFILSTVLDMGSRNSLAFFIGADPEAAPRYVRQAFLLWLLLVLLAPPALWLSFATSSMTGGVWHLLAPTTILLAAMLYLRMMQGALLGTGEIALYNRTELASRVVLLVLTLGFLATHALTLVSALWTLALSQAIAALMLFAAQLPTIRAGRDGAPGLGLAWTLTVRGFPFMLSVLLMNASKRMAFLVVSEYAPGDGAGLFFALQRLTEIITEVGLAVAVVAFSHSVRAGAREDAAHQVAHSTRVAFALFLLIALALAATGSWSVPLLMGPKFTGHTELFLVLLLATLAGSIWTVVYPSLSVMTSPMTAFWLFVPGLVVNVVAIAPLMGLFGMQGAAGALLLANIVLSFSFLLVFRRRFGVPMRDFLLPRATDFAGALRRLRRRKATVGS